MARPKKADVEKKAAAAAAAQQAVPVAPLAPIGIAPNPIATGVVPRAIDVENFVRVRDSVVGRLTTIQELIRSFTADYQRQTNLLLGVGESAELGIAAAALPPIAGLDSLTHFAPIPEAAPAVEEKKERKKRQHDPNAPKRPLTPYFLYMQTARPIIAKDLGEEAPKGAVQEEGQRRWGSMGAGEKSGWNAAYQYNLRLYNARVHAYKAGNQNAKEMTDAEAEKYANEHNLGAAADAAEDAPAANEADAIAEQLQAAAAPAAEETPKPKGRKRKSTAAEVAEEADTSTAKGATPAEKKRKRQSKVAETPSEEPKKAGRGKKKN